MAQRWTMKITCPMKRKPKTVRTRRRLHQNVSNLSITADDRINELPKTAEAQDGVYAAATATMRPHVSMHQEPRIYDVSIHQQPRVAKGTMIAQQNKAMLQRLGRPWKSDHPSYPPSHDVRIWARSVRADGSAVDSAGTLPNAAEAKRSVHAAATPPRDEIRNSDLSTVIASKTAAAATVCLPQALQVYDVHRAQEPRVVTRDSKRSGSHHGMPPPERLRGSCAVLQMERRSSSGPGY